MIPKADRDADAATIAAATRGTWITAALPARAASPEIRLGSFGPCVDTPRGMLVMVCIQAPGATFGDVAMAEATTSWEQHAANAKAAAHAVNRLPEYIANAAEMETALTALVATLPRCDGALGDDDALPCCKPGQRQPAMWGGNELMWCDGHHAAGYGEEQLPHATAARAAISLLRGGK